MTISRLDIHHLRAISSARLVLNPRCNIFHGSNGSGKTSLLEAVYVLGNGHSFRTRDIDALISREQESLTVFAQTDKGDSLSLQKSKAGTFARLNQRACSRRSELASFLPCQVFYQDIFDIIDAGPSVRRSLLDWGLFHVKHEYHVLWKDYRRVLKQRNALLRQKAQRFLFTPWDRQLVDISESLHETRALYCEEWFTLFKEMLGELTTFDCQPHYEKGWDKKRTGKGLKETLDDQFEMDTLRQHTHSGAHQADIGFDVDHLKAKQTLSRGQQKIVLIALKLAQSRFLSEHCVYLFDDIASELDMSHLHRFFDMLSRIKGQFLFTALEPSLFHAHWKAPAQDFSFFLIDQGRFVSTSPE
jgi:DNA replication and repair protein RecF